MQQPQQQGIDHLSDATVDYIAARLGFTGRAMVQPSAISDRQFRSARRRLGIARLSDLIAERA